MIQRVCHGQAKSGKRRNESVLSNASARMQCFGDRWSTGDQIGTKSQRARGKLEFQMKTINAACENVDRFVVVKKSNRPWNIILSIFSHGV